MISLTTSIQSYKLVCHIVNSSDTPNNFILKIARHLPLDAYEITLISHSSVPQCNTISYISQKSMLYNLDILLKNVFNFFLFGYKY